jgi:hypothetical protein
MRSSSRISRPLARWWKGPWQPWYAEANRAPAGYVTTYSVPGKTFQSHGPDAAFLTIRLAGRMVPTFQPEAALAFIARFFRGEASKYYVIAESEGRKEGRRSKNSS